MTAFDKAWNIVKKKYDPMVVMCKYCGHATNPILAKRYGLSSCNCGDE